MDEIKVYLPICCTDYSFKSGAWQYVGEIFIGSAVLLEFGWVHNISAPLFPTVHICLAMQCNFGCHLSHSLASMHYGKVEKCGKKIANFDHLFLHRFWPKSMHLLSFASLILDDFTYCKINCWTHRQVVHRPCISPNSSAKNCLDDDS